MTPIAAQTFVLVLYLTVMWGIYFAHTIREYRRPEATTPRRLRVANFRRAVVGLCVFALPASFLLRTLLVLMGAGNEVIGQILFFALAGPNVIGSTFVVISLRFD